MTAPPTIDVDLVRALLAEQHPDLADLAVVAVGGGWDNVLFRLGDDLTARLPRRVEAAPLIDFEHRWVPGLVAGMPTWAEGGLSTSAPLREGRPGRGYPWSWSIGPWLPGSPAATTPFADPVDAARRLGRFLHRLHQPAPPEAPVNPYRGVPLRDRSERLVLALAEVAERGIGLGPAVTADAVERVWGELVDTAPWTRPPVWLHGDPHPLNLLVDDGALVAVIDFGDLTSGDPASDLSAAWLVFPEGARAAFRSAAGDVDDDTWTRARAWALTLSVSYLAGAPLDSPLVGVAQRTLGELVG